MKVLYKYQQEVVDRAEPSTALFWDMGLGKTITSLEIFKKFYNQGKVKRLFVMCPISMIDEWCREFESQVDLKAISYRELVKVAKKNGLKTNVAIQNFNINCIVLNYDMVWRIEDYSWLDSEWMLICDESHRIKNPGSKIGKYMKFLKYKTQYKICLTGTPQSQGYIDYYNQLYFLDKMDMTMAEFKNKYCMYEDKVFNGIKIKQLSGYKNVGEFERLYLSQCEFLKMERVYDEVIKYHTIQVEPPKEYYRVLKDRVIYYDNFGNVVTNRKCIEDYLNGDKWAGVVADHKYLDNPGSYRYGLRSLLNSDNKIAWLRDFLEDYDKRVVIFYNYNVELLKLKDLCEKMKRPYSVYNGEEKSFDNFKNYENGVCFCNYQSGSVGINDLVISNIFIAYSPCDNYINWEQSKKRIDRNGQKHTPIYYFLESGLESRIYHALSVGKNFDDRVFIKEMEENLI